MLLCLSEADYQKRGFNYFSGGGEGGGCDFRSSFGVVVILLSILCSYDNLILKLHQKNRSYLDEV